MLRILRAAVLVACGLPLTTASLMAAAPNPSLQAVRAGDVSVVYGAGFVPLVARTVSNEEIGTLSATPALTIKVYQREGRVTGFETAFRRAVKRPAVDYVFSEVDVYRTVAGPLWRLNYARAHPSTIESGFTVHPIHVGNIGNGGYYAAFSGRPAGSAAAKIYGASLSFRRGRYLATVVVSSSAPLDSRGVYRLGDIVDGRLRPAR